MSGAVLQPELQIGEVQLQDREAIGEVPQVLAIGILRQIRMAMTNGNNYEYFK